MGVIVVNFGAHDLLAANVGEMPSGVDVFVVDNMHSEAERARITSLCAERGWHLIAQAGNPGFGAGCNDGIRHALESGCESFLLLNPDARITLPVVEELRAHVHREPLTLVAPCIDDSAGRRVFQGVELLLDTGRMRRARLVGPNPSGGQLWLTGACLALHREAFDRIGGFDAEYFLYWEDVDLSVRAVRAGCALVVRSDLTVCHDEGATHAGSPGSRAKSEIYYYYNCRNRLYFAAQHLGRQRLLAWLRCTPSASWEILMRGGKRQLLHSPRPLWAAVRGTGAGIAVAIAALIRPQRKPWLS